MAAPATIALWQLSHPARSDELSERRPWQRRAHRYRRMGQMSLLVGSGRDTFIGSTGNDVRRGAGRRYSALSHLAEGSDTFRRLFVRERFFSVSGLATKNTRIADDLDRFCTFMIWDSAKT